MVYKLKNLTEWQKLVKEINPTNFMASHDQFFRDLDTKSDYASLSSESEVFDYYYNGYLKHITKNKLLQFPLVSIGNKKLVQQQAVFSDFWFDKEAGVICFKSMLTTETDGKIKAVQSPDGVNWVIKHPANLLRGMVYDTIAEFIFQWAANKHAIFNNLSTDVKHYQRYSSLRHQLQEVCLPFLGIKQLSFGRLMDPLEVDPPVRTCMVNNSVCLSGDICQTCCRCEQHCKCNKTTASSSPSSSAIITSLQSATDAAASAVAEAALAITVAPIKKMDTDEDGVISVCQECKKPASKKRIAVEDVQTMKHDHFCVDWCCRRVCANIRNCTEPNCYRCLDCGHSKECIHYTEKKAAPATSTDMTDNEDEDEETNEMDKEEEEDPEGNESADKCWVCKKDGANTICVKCKDKAIDEKNCQDCLLQYHRLRPATCSKCGLCGDCCPLDQPRCKCSPKCRRFVSCCLCEKHTCDKKTPRCIAE